MNVLILSDTNRGQQKLKGNDIDTK